MNDGHEPATKANIEALREALREQISGTETKLLRAFYDFAKANQHRVSELEGSDATLTRRIGSIEGRLLEVERRLNMPPAA